MMLHILLLAPPAMRKLEIVSALDCADLCRELPALALQAADIAVDFEGGALRFLELRDNRNRLRFRVVYLIDSANRTVTVLNIIDAKEWKHLIQKQRI